MTDRLSQSDFVFPVQPETKQQKKVADYYNSVLISGNSSLHRGVEHLRAVENKASKTFLEVESAPLF